MGFFFLCVLYFCTYLFIYLLFVFKISFKLLSEYFIVKENLASLEGLEALLALVECFKVSASARAEQTPAFL